MKEISKASDLMEKVIESAKVDFSGISAGRANTALLDKILVDYYSNMTPIKQLASVHVSDARSILITPYDKNILDSVVKALETSDIGVTAVKEGDHVRVTIPEMTGERREEYIKLAKQKAEAARVAIRNIRHNTKKEIDKLVKDKEITEDDCYAANDKLDGKTKAKISVIDDLLVKKEQDLRSV